MVFIGGKLLKRPISSEKPRTLSVDDVHPFNSSASIGPPEMFRTRICDGTGFVPNWTTHLS